MTKVNAAVHVLNRMLELGRPSYVHILWSQTGLGHYLHLSDPCTTLTLVATRQSVLALSMRTPTGAVCDIIKETTWQMSQTIRRPPAVG